MGRCGLGVERGASEVTRRSCSQRGWLSMVTGAIGSGAVDRAAFTDLETDEGGARDLEAFEGEAAVEWTPMPTPEDRDDA